MAICNAFGSRTEQSRRNAFGQHASRLAEVCESPLANKTTSCPSVTSSSINHEITPLRASIELGRNGLSQRGYLRDLHAQSCLEIRPGFRALQAATAKPRFARRAGPDGTLRPSREP